MYQQKTSLAFASQGFYFFYFHLNLLPEWHSALWPLNRICGNMGMFFWLSSSSISTNVQPFWACFDLHWQNTAFTTRRRKVAAASARCGARPRQITMEVKQRVCQRTHYFQECYNLLLNALIRSEVTDKGVVNVLGQLLEVKLAALTSQTRVRTQSSRWLVSA